MMVMITITTATPTMVKSYNSRNRIQTHSRERDRAMKKFLQEHYDSLGRITQHEIVVLVLFSTLVFLWVFRAPGFVTGWAQFFTDSFDEKVYVCKECVRCVKLYLIRWYIYFLYEGQ